MPKHEEESPEQQEGDWPLSPASLASEHTASTSAGGTVDSNGVPMQLVLRELSCMSEMLTNHMQEVQSLQDLPQEQRQGSSVELQQQLLARESEAQGLREKLQEAEKEQAKRQMEMKVLKQALQRERSLEALQRELSKATDG